MVGTRVGWALVLCVLCNSASAQTEEDDFPPGLLAKYIARDRSIERIDAEIAFDWQSAAPDPRLPTGPFSVSWKSQLLVRQELEYTFHAFVQGEVTFEIDGQTVLEGDRQKPGWISGKPISLDFGEKELRVRYRKTGDKASIKLYWSARAFYLEPLPAFLMFRDGGRPDLALIDRGRIAFDSHRCDRCHRREGHSPSPVAPSLRTVTGSDADWLISKIENAAHGSPHSQMPTFAFARTEAESIAAFLLGRSEQVTLQKLPKSKDAKKDRRQGEILFRSVGCSSCHTASEEGQSGPFGGGDLSNIGAKRSPNWLFSWLANPGKLNADHRMPVFELSKNERRQLAFYLQSLRKNPAETNSRPEASLDDRRLIETGRKLVESARCANCHRIDGVSPPSDRISDLSQPVKDWSRSCLAEKPDRDEFRPAFKNLDRDALRAFVESRFGSIAPLSQFDLGRRVIQRKNCLACHERGRSKGNREIAGRFAGLDNALRGQSEAMIPPALTAVGDKLHDEALAKAIRGEQPQRMPWLHIRMPKFSYSDAEQSALLNHLIAHDRIEKGHSVSTPEETQKLSDSQRLVAGHTLVGAQGFSCIACHQVGDYEPRNVALGTRGSDLLGLGKRMREPFFLRWTHSPLRIVPGMEMPSYNKPVPGMLEENVDLQLRTMWQALNDPRFTPPTNPSVVEQFFTVKPGEPPRIVRDVFTNPAERDGGHIARAFAVGLNNGHNVLFDLDSFTVRAWSFGDFARQRTEGKSWYWDLAGIQVQSGFDDDSDFALRKRGEGVFLFPKRDESQSGKLLKYWTADDAVYLQYELHFEVGGKLHRLIFDERFGALPDGRRTGWQRHIILRNELPKGYELWFARPKSASVIGRPTIEVEQDSFEEERWQADSNRKNREWIRLSDDAPDLFIGPATRRAIVHYTCDLQRETPKPKGPQPLEPIAVEKVTSLPGYDGSRLPISRSIMPTAIAWTNQMSQAIPADTLAFTSLKGHIYLARDTDGDGVEDEISLFAEGLSAPFGLSAYEDGLIVAHKPELLLLKDSDGDGRADYREVIATGWGYSDNYHDWTCGIVRDKSGNLYIGLGSDYAQNDRPRDRDRWRGAILKIDPDRKITPVGFSFRYPTGLAINDREQIVVSDQQGVQNTFNEINLLIEGRHYGVPSRYEETLDVSALPATVQLPHPWTRSVNGLFFLPKETMFAGHGIGCEYNGRFLIRFSLQQVGETWQGATYYFSKPNLGQGKDNFLGPMCGAVAPDGAIYIGSIHDSGWLGGRNTGGIVKLTPAKDSGEIELANGIKELRAIPDGFEIEFLKRVDSDSATDTDNYSISGYRRIWKGGYATPDSDRHRIDVTKAAISADGKRVTLATKGLREGFVYEVSCGEIGAESNRDLFPATGHYTLHRIPKK